MDNETCWYVATNDGFFLCPLYFTASLLKGLKHANIVLLHDIIHTKETLTLVFEYVVSEIRKIQTVLVKCEQNPHGAITLGFCTEMNGISEYMSHSLVYKNRKFLSMHLVRCVDIYSLLVTSMLTL